MECRLTAGFLHAALQQADTTLGFKQQWENKSANQPPPFLSQCV